MRMAQVINLLKAAVFNELVEFKSKFEVPMPYGINQMYVMDDRGNNLTRYVFSGILTAPPKRVPISILAQSHLVYYSLRSEDALCLRAHKCAYDRPTLVKHCMEIISKPVKCWFTFVIPTYQVQRTWSCPTLPMSFVIKL